MYRPSVDVVIPTWPNHYARFAYFSKCVWSLIRNLRGLSVQTHFYVSAESEQDPKKHWYGYELTRFCQVMAIPLEWRDGPADLGANMNAAIRMGTSDYVLLVQDDFELMKVLDLWDGVKWLRDHDYDLLRYMCSGTEFTGELDGMRLVNIDGKWSYGDNPHIRHRSFMDKYGWYAEGIPHAQSETQMLFHLVQQRAKIGATKENLFRHVGEVTAVINDNRKRKVAR